MFIVKLTDSQVITMDSLNIGSDVGDNGYFLA